MRCSGAKGLIACALTAALLLSACACGAVFAAKAAPAEKAPSAEGSAAAADHGGMPRNTSAGEGSQPQIETPRAGQSGIASPASDKAGGVDTPIIVEPARTDNALGRQRSATPAFRIVNRSTLHVPPRRVAPAPDMRNALGISVAPRGGLGTRADDRLRLLSAPRPGTARGFPPSGGYGVAGVRRDGGIHPAAAGAAVHAPMNAAANAAMTATMTAPPNRRFATGATVRSQQSAARLGGSAKSAGGINGTTFSPKH